mmetsp:Transcript_41905/g.87963  ORF Transcript_41905/g.87963 Transcript_41905/m.87963 type:complete len:88 (+) Transcript_41905:409-672(+)
MAMNKILCLKKRMSSCSLLLFYSKPNKATDQYVNAGAPQSLRQRSIFFISHVHIEEVKPLSCCNPLPNIPSRTHDEDDALLIHPPNS